MYPAAMRKNSAPVPPRNPEDRASSHGHKKRSPRRSNSTTDSVSNHDESSEHCDCDCASRYDNDDHRRALMLADSSAVDDRYRNPLDISGRTFHNSYAKDKSPPAKNNSSYNKCCIRFHNRNINPSLYNSPEDSDATKVISTTDSNDNVTLESEILLINEAMDFAESEKETDLVDKVYEEDMDISDSDTVCIDVDDPIVIDVDTPEPSPDTQQKRKNDFSVPQPKRIVCDRLGVIKTDATFLDDVEDSKTDQATEGAARTLPGSVDSGAKNNPILDKTVSTLKMELDKRKMRDLLSILSSDQKSIEISPIQIGKSSAVPQNLKDDPVFQNCFKQLDDLMGDLSSPEHLARKNPADEKTPKTACVLDFDDKRKNAEDGKKTDEEASKPSEDSERKAVEDDAGKNLAQRSLKEIDLFAKFESSSLLLTKDKGEKVVQRRHTLSDNSKSDLNLAASPNSKSAQIGERRRTFHHMSHVRESSDVRDKPGDDENKRTLPKLDDNENNARATKPDDSENRRPAPKPDDSDGNKPTPKRGARKRGKSCDARASDPVYKPPQEVRSKSVEPRKEFTFPILRVTRSNSHLFGLSDPLEWPKRTRRNSRPMITDQADKENWAPRLITSYSPRFDDEEVVTPARPFNYNVKPTCVDPRDPRKNQLQNVPKILKNGRELVTLADYVKDELRGGGNRNYKYGDANKKNVYAGSKSTHGRNQSEYVPPKKVAKVMNVTVTVGRVGAGSESSPLKRKVPNGAKQGEHGAGQIKSIKSPDSRGKEKSTATAAKESNASKETRAPKLKPKVKDPPKTNQTAGTNKDSSAHLSAKNVNAEKKNKDVTHHRMEKTKSSANIISNVVVKKAASSDDSVRKNSAGSSRSDKESPKPQSALKDCNAKLPAKNLTMDKRHKDATPNGSDKTSNVVMKNAVSNKVAEEKISAEISRSDKESPKPQSALKDCNAKLPAKNLTMDKRHKDTAPDGSDKTSNVVMKNAVSNNVAEEKISEGTSRSSNESSKPQSVVKLIGSILSSSSDDVEERSTFGQSVSIVKHGNEVLSSGTPPAIKKPLQAVSNPNQVSVANIPNDTLKPESRSKVDCEAISAAANETLIRNDSLPSCNNANNANGNSAGQSNIEHANESLRANKSPLVNEALAIPGDVSAHPQSASNCPQMAVAVTIIYNNLTSTNTSNVQLSSIGQCVSSVVRGMESLPGNTPPIIKAIKPQEQCDSNKSKNSPEILQPQPASKINPQTTPPETLPGELNISTENSLMLDVPHQSDFNVSTSPINPTAEPQQSSSINPVNQSTPVNQIKRQLPTPLLKACLAQPLSETPLNVSRSPPGKSLPMLPETDRSPAQNPNEKSKQPKTSSRKTSKSQQKPQESKPAPAIVPSPLPANFTQNNQMSVVGAQRQRTHAQFVERYRKYMFQYMSISIIWTTTKNAMASYDESGTERTFLKGFLDRRIFNLQKEIHDYFNGLCVNQFNFCTFLIQLNEAIEARGVKISQYNLMMILRKLHADPIPCDFYNTFRNCINSYCSYVLRKQTTENATAIPPAVSDGPSLIQTNPGLNLGSNNQQQNIGHRMPQQVLQADSRVQLTTVHHPTFSPGLQNRYTGPPFPPTITKAPSAGGTHNFQTGPGYQPARNPTLNHLQGSPTLNHLQGSPTCRVPNNTPAATVEPIADSNKITVATLKEFRRPPLPVVPPNVVINNRWPVPTPPIQPTVSPRTEMSNNNNTNQRKYAAGTWFPTATTNNYCGNQMQQPVQNCGVSSRMMTRPYLVSNNVVNKNQTNSTVPGSRYPPPSPFATNKINGNRMQQPVQNSGISPGTMTRPTLALNNVNNNQTNPTGPNQSQFSGTPFTSNQLKVLRGQIAMHNMLCNNKFTLRKTPTVHTAAPISRNKFDATITRCDNAATQRDLKLPLAQINRFAQSGRAEIIDLTEIDDVIRPPQCTEAVTSRQQIERSTGRGLTVAGLSESTAMPKNPNPNAQPAETIDINSLLASSPSHNYTQEQFEQLFPDIQVQQRNQLIVGAAQPNSTQIDASSNQLTKLNQRSTINANELVNLSLECDELESKPSVNLENVDMLEVTPQIITDDSDNDKNKLEINQSHVTIGDDAPNFEFIDLENYFKQKKDVADDDIEMYWPDSYEFVPFVECVVKEESQDAITAPELEDPIPRNLSVDSGMSSPTQVDVPATYFEDRYCLCGNHAVYVCKCRGTMYCSVACQLKDWPQHSILFH